MNSAQPYSLMSPDHRRAYTEEVLPVREPLRQVQPRFIDGETARLVYDLAAILERHDSHRPP